MPADTAEFRLTFGLPNLPFELLKFFPWQQKAEFERVSATLFRTFITDSQRDNDR